MRSGDVLDVEGNRILVRNALHRVFNRGAFDLGGRFYGAWWQNVTSDERQRISLNGAPCIELDYSQLHPRLLYAIAGKPLTGDAYTIEGWNRPLVKEAMNTLINADDELSAKQSIARSIGGKGALGKAQKLTEQIKAKHLGIADCFGTGAGLRLMRIDSDMAESVQLKLIRRGIVGLPIHDSFIVEERHAGVLKEIMDEVFDLTLRRIAGRRTTPTPLTKKVPQYGGGGGEGKTGLVVVVNTDGGGEVGHRGVGYRGGHRGAVDASIVAANDTSVVADTPANDTPAVNTPVVDASVVAATDNEKNHDRSASGR